MLECIHWLRLLNLKLRTFHQKEKTSVKSKTNFGKKIGCPRYTANQLQTYYERPAIDRFKKLECTVDEQSDKSLGFLYRSLKCGQVMAQNICYSFISPFFLIDHSIAVCWRSCSFLVTQQVSLVRTFFSILRAYVKCEPPSSTSNTVKVLDRILHEDIISQFLSFLSQFTAPFITALGLSTK